MSVISEQILQELKEISPAIATLSRKNVYSVPLNYFDGLAGNIMQFIGAGIAGHSFPLSTQQPFTVPKNYFETLPTNIIAAIKHNTLNVSEVETELADVAPLLNTLSKTMPYTVPHGYFEQLPNYALPAKTVTPMVAIKGYKKLMNIAVAAALTGLIALSTYLFTNESKGTNQFVNAASINITTAVTNISDVEIINYLNENNFGIEAAAAQISQDEEIDINEGIQNMSEEEIRNFLKENPEPLVNNAKES